MLKDVEEWAKDKSFFMALFAPQIVSNSKDMYEALRYIKDRRVFDHQFPLPNFPSWFQLYRSQGKAVRVYLEFICEMSEYGSDLISFWLGLRELKKVLAKNPDVLKEVKPSPQELQERVEFLKGLLAKSFAEIKEDMDSCPFDIDKQLKCHELLAKYELELGFSFLVFAPCWLLYQMSPSELYREALDRDERQSEKALKRLLKLDPLLLHDPVIGKKIQEFRFSGKSSNSYDEIIKAVHSKPIITYSNIKSGHKSMKYEAAAIISEMAQALDNPVDNPELRNLYDAYAKQGKNILGDHDFPDSNDGFDKGIKHHLPHWQELFQKLRQGK